MNLPADKYGLFLEHNPHRVYHQTVEEYVENLQLGESWVSPEEEAHAKGLDDFWIIQWYPDTTVGFYVLLGHSLEELLKEASKI